MLFSSEFQNEKYFCQKVCSENERENAERVTYDATRKGLNTDIDVHITLSLLMAYSKT